MYVVGRPSLDLDLDLHHPGMLDTEDFRNENM